MATLGDYQTTKEAGKRLKVEERRVRQLCQAGEIEATKIGGVWLVRKDSWPLDKGFGRPPNANVKNY